jgi:hypothetical protein
MLVFTTSNTSAGYTFTLANFPRNGAICDSAPINILYHKIMMENDAAQMLLCIFARFERRKFYYAVFLESPQQLFII